MQVTIMPGQDGVNCWKNSPLKICLPCGGYIYDVRYATCLQFRVCIHSYIRQISIVQGNLTRVTRFPKFSPTVTLTRPFTYLIFKTLSYWKRTTITLLLTFLCATVISCLY